MKKFTLKSFLPQTSITLLVAGALILSSCSTSSEEGSDKLNSKKFMTSGELSASESAESSQIAQVVGRYVFYNNSRFNSIAPDKEALLPGVKATFANYTSYVKGINGIVVDVANLELPLEQESFTFKVGNSDDTSEWEDLAVIPEISVIPEAGIEDSTRIKLVFDDYLIKNTWLQVTVKTELTGLSRDDVFYFGNAVGESGNSDSDAIVDIADMEGARNNPRHFLNPAPIDFPYDYNRDQRVNAMDMLIARDNQGSFLVTGTSFGSGCPDVPWGTNGKVILDLGGDDERFRSGVIQKDGKIIMTGKSNGIPVLFRFNCDGSRDLDFGDNGVVFHDNGYQEIILQPSGKIIVNKGLTPKRFNSDGSPDDSFVPRWTTGSGAKLVSSPNGKITAAFATRYTSRPNYFYVVGFNENGSSVHSTLVPIGDLVSLHDMLVDEQGNISLVGGVKSDERWAHFDSVYVKLNSRGTLITKTVTSMDRFDDSLSAIAFLSSLGLFGVTVNSEHLVSIDQSLTSIGANLPVTNSRRLIRAQNDTNLLVRSSVGSDEIVQRYFSNGTLDPSFGVDGSVTVQLGYHGGRHSMLVQDDGKILLLGQDGAYNTDGDFLAIRLRADGTIDE